jgi:phosphate transport system permease protein
MSTKRKLVDIVYQIITYIGAIMSVFFLGMIIYFIVDNGASLINLDMLTGDYHTSNFNGKPSSDAVLNFDMPDYPSDVYVSETYGIALYDDQDRAGDTVIKVYDIHPDSPFNGLIDTNNEDTEISIKEEQVINRIAYFDGASSLTRFGAARMISDLESGLTIREISFSTIGGGIRGSLITTLYLIGITLLMALPIGIFTAIYLNEFAPINKVTSTLRSFIDTLTGVPSIIYGLLGVTLFIPLTVSLNLSQGPNLIAGGMTLSVILLPVIIKTTEESLRVIPNTYRQASLALGANKTQTVFKVVLPNALSGILTATFLAIGRIIGESAALIFVLGTAVKDRVVVDEGATTLAVHIFSMMTDEPANIALSSAIALIILLIVLTLNVGVKFTMYKLNKRGGK